MKEAFENHEQRKIEEIEKELKNEIKEIENIKDHLNKEEKQLKKTLEEVEELEHKVVVLIVNAEPKDWDKKTISYKEVVKLATGEYKDEEQFTYAVTYKRGPKQNPEGKLGKGETVYVKNEMEFYVVPTNRS